MKSSAETACDIVNSDDLQLLNRAPFDCSTSPDLAQSVIHATPKTLSDTVTSERGGDG
jgi:hypothetical protein